MNDAGQAPRVPAARPLRDRRERPRRRTGAPPTSSTSTPSTSCACSTSTGSSAARRAATSSPLLRELRMPIVTTLHTILAEPNPLQRARDGRARAALRAPRRHERARRDAAPRGARRARAQDRPHPARDPAPSRSRARSKDQLGVEGRSVILTFGLLSPDKGIEYVIDALPAILARYPDTRLHRARRDPPARARSSTARPTGSCSRAARSGSASTRA